MSEPILRAIIRLFAIVAKEDLVNKQERDQIAAFLNDHVGQRMVGPHLSQFDSYCEEIANHNQEQEANDIDEICRSINIEVAQKQKMVIMIELLSIVMADGTVSPREAKLSK
jgi:ABC transport system ATP-binding/permease protein